MNGISAAAAFICGCAVICSIINLAAPNAKMRKSASLALAVFFLCSIISPLKEFIDGISAFTQQSHSNPQIDVTAAFDYDELILEQTVQNLVESADKLLKEEGYPAKNIQISAHIDANNSIKLDSIDIYIDEVSNTDILKIRNSIFKNFGLVPDIMAVNENGT